MHRIDNALAVGTLPTPTPVDTPGYFQDTNPTLGGTYADADWFNAVQEELISVILQGGGTPTKGTNTQVRDAILAILAAPASNPFMNYAHFRHEEASGVHAGGLTAGVWTTRPLRDPGAGVVNNIAGCSINANQIELPAGKYRLVASADGNDVGIHVLGLYNITDGVFLDFGRNANTTTSSDIQTTSQIVSTFTIADTKIIELQQRSSNTESTWGLGRANGFADFEVYADLELWKVG